MDISSNVTLTEAPTTYLGALGQLESQQPPTFVVACSGERGGFLKNLWEKNSIPKSEFSARIPVLVLSVKKD